MSLVYPHTPFLNTQSGSLFLFSFWFTVKVHSNKGFFSCSDLPLLYLILYNYRIQIHTVMLQEAADPLVRNVVHRAIEFLEGIFTFVLY